MKAGATAGRDVGQVYEFPENFRGDRRRALGMLGSMASMNTAITLSSMSAEPSAADPLVLMVNAMLWVVLLKLAFSKRPMAFRDGTVEVGGRQPPAGTILGLDVVIDRGRPGAKNYRTKLVVTIAGAHGHDRTVVTTGAPTEQTRRMLKEARHRLPHALVRD